MNSSDGKYIESLSGNYQVDRLVIEGHLNNLHTYIDELRETLENYRDREGFNVRLEALKAAREHVSGLPSEQVNQRGYRDHSLPPAARVTMELQVAGYLLGGEREA